MNRLYRLKIPLIKCEKCGDTFNLSVHHLDCNRNNNGVNNLISLCHKCHRDLHNDKWKLSDIGVSIQGSNKNIPMSLSPMQRRAFDMITKLNEFEENRIFTLSELIGIQKPSMKSLVQKGVLKTVVGPFGDNGPEYYVRTDKQVE